jgi:hypothetical protein
MLPVEHSANWIFRMTERSQVRSAQLVVAPAALRALASIGPTLLFLLPQWHTFGAARAAASAFVQLVYGELLIELLIADWRRIPFTCSYMPGKRFLGHTVLIAFAGWMVFTVSGPVIALTLSRGSRLAAGLCFVVIAIVATLKTMRRRMWRELPLMFEDELPVDVVPIRLSG